MMLFRKIILSFLFTFFLCVNDGVMANTVDPTSFYNNFEKIKLTDQNGNIFKTSQLDSKISIFNFIYTECVSVCSLQTSELLKIYESLSPEVKKDIRLVSISLDPIKDNPKKLKLFAKRLNADVDGWVFLSTNFKDLIELASKISLFREYHGKTIYEDMNPEKKKNYKLEDHKAGLWLIDAEGHVRQRYVGNPVEIKRVINEVNILHSLQFKKKL